MQITQKDLNEQIDLIYDSWKEMPDGKFINILDDELKYHTAEEKQKRVTKSVDDAIAIFGNDAKQYVQKHKDKEYDSETRTIHKNSKKPKKKEIQKIKFDAVIRENKEVIRKMDLTFNERAVYRELCALCEGKDNAVVIDKEIPSLRQLEDAIGIKSRTLSGYFDKLEELELIKRKSFFHKKMIFLNPKYYTTYLNYENLSREVRELFDIMLEVTIE